eukprot:scaffold18.g1985.t1
MLGAVLPLRAPSPRNRRATRLSGALRSRGGGGESAAEQTPLSGADAAPSTSGPAQDEQQEQQRSGGSVATPGEAEPAAGAAVAVAPSAARQRRRTAGQHSGFDCFVLGDSAGGLSDGEECIFEEDSEEDEEFDDDGGGEEAARPRRRRRTEMYWAQRFGIEVSQALVNHAFPFLQRLEREAAQLQQLQASPPRRRRAKGKKKVEDEEDEEHLYKSMVSVAKTLPRLAVIAIQDAVELAARGLAGANPVVQYLARHHEFGPLVDEHKAKILSGAYTSEAPCSTNAMLREITGRQAAPAFRTSCPVGCGGAAARVGDAPAAPAAGEPGGSAAQPAPGGSAAATGEPSGSRDAEVVRLELQLKLRDRELELQKERNRELELLAQLHGLQRAGGGSTAALVQGSAPALEAANRGVSSLALQRSTTPSLPPVLPPVLPGARAASAASAPTAARSSAVATQAKGNGLTNGIRLVTELWVHETLEGVSFTCMLPFDLLLPTCPPL